MKKTISLLIVLTMILGTVLLYTGCSGSQTAELNILNWGIILIRSSLSVLSRKRASM